jgi:DNA-binding NarL/FixJ family response regulator
VIPWRSSAAVAARKVGDHDVAHRLVEEELRLAERWGDQRALGNVLRVAAALRADDPAAEHELLSRSAELLRDSPAQLDRAATLLALGRLGRYAQHPDAAAEHLTEALHLASIAGAKPLADACREALRSLGRRPRRPFVSGVDSLTASERRVAALAAKGSSNREVAEELYVTVKTVDTHLGAVFRKLGITNRGQLAERLRTSSSV